MKWKVCFLVKPNTHFARYKFDAIYVPPTNCFNNELNKRRKINVWTIRRLNGFWHTLISMKSLELFWNQDFLNHLITLDKLIVTILIIIVIIDKFNLFVSFLNCVVVPDTQSEYFMRLIVIALIVIT